MAAGDKQSAVGGDRFRIGNVGAGARVAQGKHITWAEGRSPEPGANALSVELAELLTSLQEASDLDPVVRKLAVEKATVVVDALSDARESPDRLHEALADAQTFLSARVDWAWSRLVALLNSLPAIAIIEGISEGATRAAIQGMVGLSG